MVIGRSTRVWRSTRPNIRNVSPRSPMKVLTPSSRHPRKPARTKRGAYVWGGIVYGSGEDARSPGHRPWVEPRERDRERAVVVEVEEEAEALAGAERDAVLHEPAAPGR